MQATINHGTYFYHAAQEGLLANHSNMHVGIRTTLSGPSDYDNDGYCGFEIVEAREIDTIGTKGIIERILKRVGDGPVYLSIDIDTLDPACTRPLFLCDARADRLVAPATGTPETGGWSTREMRTILRGLESLNFVAADIVEVSRPSPVAISLTDRLRPPMTPTPSSRPWPPPISCMRS
jgi:agmatinase